MAKTRTQELEALREQASKERGAGRELDLELTRAREAREAARAALIEAHASRDGKRVKAAKAKLEKAQATAEDAEIRHEAAQLRIRRAQYAAERFESENARALIAELKPAADQAVEQLNRAARELVEGDARWNELSARVSALVAHVPGASARGDAPSQHGLSTIAHDVRRALRDGVEARGPLPHYASLRVAQEEEQRRRKVLQLRRGEAA